jgi:putative transposase
MSLRKENFIEGEYYHIYNRGNSKQDIFLDNQDYDRFVKLLYLCNSTKNINFREDIVEKKIDVFDFDREDQIVSIGAWVLMPNHFHLYTNISQRSFLWEGQMTIFMKKLCTGYSMYFNKRHERTGKLFEGAFKSVHIKNDEHAKYNFSYIHLNPVKLIDSKWKENGTKDTKKTLEFLNKYKWSSYQDYKGIKRPENKIILAQDFPDYFSNKKIFEEEIFDWLSFNEK